MGQTDYGTGAPGGGMTFQDLWNENDRLKALADEFKAERDYYILQMREAKERADTAEARVAELERDLFVICREMFAGHAMHPDLIEKLRSWYLGKEGE